MSNAYSPIVEAWLLTYLIHSTIWLGSIWLLFRIWPGKNYRLKEFLWKSAALGGLISASLDPMPLFPAPAKELVQTESSPSGNEPLTLLVMTEEVATEPVPQKSSWYPWATRSIGLCCLTIAAMGLLRYVWRWLKFWRYEAKLSRLDSGRASLILNQLLHELGKRVRVRLLIDRMNSEPAAYGIWNWSIVVPRRAVEELSDKDLRSLLAHELGHLIRRDPLWLVIGNILCHLLGFQFLNFVARREWSQASEISCDDWAVQRTQDPVSLARCLTRVAEWRFLVKRPGWVSAATGLRSIFSTRIERLVAEEPSRSPSCFTGWLMVFSLFCLITILGPRLQAETGDPHEPASHPRARIDVELSLLWGELTQEIQILREELDSLDGELNHKNIGAAPIRDRAAQIRLRLENLESFLNQMRLESTKAL